MIKEFRKEYFFLSNFYETEIVYEGRKFLCSEAAFQASKCKRESTKNSFLHLLGTEAKKRGREIKKREDWDEIKDEVMYKICKIKFSKPILRAKLLATGNEYIREENYWNDKYWGTVNGVGENKLGLILMKIREEIKEENNKLEEF